MYYPLQLEWVKPEHIHKNNAGFMNVYMEDSNYDCFEQEFVDWLREYSPDCTFKYSYETKPKNKPFLTQLGNGKARLDVPPPEWETKKVLAGITITSNELLFKLTWM